LCRDPVRSAPAIRKDAWSEPSAMSATPSGRAVVSPPWSAIAKRWTGAIKQHICVAGRETMPLIKYKHQPSKS
jgi:hypothetical protein